MQEKKRPSRSRESAGTLLYRRADDGSFAVLIVHPSGNYNRRAPWGIPKGLLDEGESLEEAARRETLEETGVEAGELTALGHVDYKKSRKRVFAFAGPAPEGAEPRCASWEVDRAEFVPIEEAVNRLHPDQLPFLERLAAHLAGEASGATSSKSSGATSSAAPSTSPVDERPSRKSFKKKTGRAD